MFPLRCERDFMADDEPFRLGPIVPDCLQRVILLRYHDFVEFSGFLKFLVQAFFAGLSLLNMRLREALLHLLH